MCRNEREVTFKTKAIRLYPFSKEARRRSRFCLPPFELTVDADNKRGSAASTFDARFKRGDGAYLLVGMCSGVAPVFVIAVVAGVLFVHWMNVR